MRRIWIIVLFCFTCSIDRLHCAVTLWRQVFSDLLRLHGVPSVDGKIMWKFCFFFQAEDGIRVWSVTGVQTCALPIYRRLGPSRRQLLHCRFIVVTRKNHLLDVVLATHPPSCFSSGLNGRQQQPNQNSNDGNDHQQFDQGESRTDNTARHKHNPKRSVVIENQLQ